MNKLKDLIFAQPALVLAALAIAAQAGYDALVAGLDGSTAVKAAITAVAGFLIRSRVTPVPPAAE